MQKMDGERVHNGEGPSEPLRLAKGGVPPPPESEKDFLFREKPSKGKSPWKENLNKGKGKKLL